MKTVASSDLKGHFHHKWNKKDESSNDTSNGTITVQLPAQIMTHMMAPIRD